MDFTVVLREVNIETHNLCTRRCVHCKYGQKRHVDKKRMPNAVFEKCIADLAAINYSEYISLYCNNEPFLDKRLCDFTRHVTRHLPNARQFLFTNGDLIDRHKLKKLYDAGLHKISISIYENSLLEKMKELQDHFGPNRIHLNPAFQADYKTQLHNFGGNIKGPIVNQTPLPDRGCMLPFRKTIVNVDGYLCLCCLDCYGDVTFDNIMDKPLHDIFISNGKLNSIRDKLKTCRGGLPLCGVCSYSGDDYTVFPDTIWERSLAAPTWKQKAAAMIQRFRSYVKP